MKSKFLPPTSALWKITLALALLLATGFFSSVLAQTNCALPPGLVSWWRGEGNAMDSVGTNHGTLRNGAGFGPGMVGRAFSLDGVDDFVLVPDSASLDLATGLTMEMWFYANDWVAGDPLIDKRTFSDCNYGLLVSTDYGVQLYYNDPNVFGGDHPGNLFEIAAHFPLPTIRTWHHIAGSFEQADPTHINVRMYLDGALVESRLFSGNLANTVNGAPVAIGSARGGDGVVFGGLIDEVSLYNRALSATEIGRIFAAGAAGKCPTNTPPPATNCVASPPNQVAWWPFDGNGMNRVGTNHALTLGGTSFGAGRVNQGLNFDGASGFAQASGPALNVGAGPGLTVEGWIRPDDLSHLRPIVEWNDGRGGFGAHFWTGVDTAVNGTRNLYANLVDTGGTVHQIFTPANVLAVGVWQHVALTYNRASGVAAIYLNGAVAAQSALGSFTPQTSFPLYFGLRPSGAFSSIFWSGGMDEMSLYGRALTAAEIAGIFGAGAAGKCATNTPPPMNCLTPPAGLAAWWPLNSNLQERIGGGVLQPAGNPPFAPAQVGAGLRFDGVDDSARAAAATNLDIGAGPGLTVELWINPSNLNVQQCLLEWSTTTGPQPGLHLFTSVNGPGSLFANLTDVNVVAHHISSGPGVLTTGVFQHVALTYERASGLARLFHNGTQVAQANFGNLRMDTRPDLWFGQRVLGGPAYRFTGVMDEVSLYSRSLSPAEIQALFAAGSAGKCPPVTPATNRPPVALSQSVTLAEDTMTSIVLAASDPDGDVLTYTVSVPAHGALTGVPPNLNYRPNLNYFGPDSFTFRVRDGALDSAVATVSITVTPVNDAPVAQGAAFTLAEDTAAFIVLLASDPDGDALTYTATMPLHGTLTGTAPNLTYRPSPNYFGPDSFTFRASDGVLASSNVAVRITITPVNDAPVTRALASPTCVLWPGETNFVAISINNSNVLLQLDGTLSSDVERDRLEFFWLADGGPIPFAMGALVTNQFPVGPHVVTLLVSDGQAMGRDTIQFEAITLGDAVAALAARVRSIGVPRNERSLLATLNAAEASFDRGNLTPGINQLEAFQNQVRAQVAPTNEALARVLHEAAQKIIDAARGGAFNPPAAPAAAKNLSPAARVLRLR